MGGFLEKPITQKDTHVGQTTLAGHIIKYGLSGMQGWRLEMEDAHVAVNELGGKDISMFSVFDGHAGKNAALHSAEHMPELVCGQDSFEDAISSPDALGEALAEAYFDMDEDMLTVPKFQDGTDHSGTTALTVCVTPTHYVFANAGDSRAILVGGPNTSVVFSTKDHKPDNPEELDRIRKAGSTVIEKRVNGDLAVSRALGDFFYKRVINKERHEQPVTAKPDVTLVPRTMETDQFLVLACDGVWDVVSNEACCEFLLDKMKTGYGIGRCCELLLDHCLELGSHDNMTVIIVTLPNAPKTIGTYREPAPQPRGNDES